jgi:hypothetical protein
MKSQGARLPTEQNTFLGRPGKSDFYNCISAVADS